MSHKMECKCPGYDTEEAETGARSITIVATCSFCDEKFCEECNTCGTSYPVTFCYECAVVGLAKKEEEKKARAAAAEVAGGGGAGKRVWPELAKSMSDLQIQLDNGDIKCENCDEPATKATEKLKFYCEDCDMARLEAQVEAHIEQVADSRGGRK